MKAKIKISIIGLMLLAMSFSSCTMTTYPTSQRTYEFQRKMRQDNVIRQIQRDQRSAIYPVNQKKH